MPYKDPAKRKTFMRAYRESHRESIAASDSKYRKLHREDIAENNARRVRIGDMYICAVGMTRKQREKFQKELEQNGKTK